jgi:hypothetical protein
MAKSRRSKNKCHRVYSWKGGPNLSKSIYYSYKDYVRFGEPASPKESDDTKNISGSTIQAISREKILELKAHGHERREEMLEREQFVLKQMKKAA